MRSTLAAALLLAAGFLPAVAQEPEIIEFEGGRITITEKDTGEKVLAFDGRIIATDYVVFLNRTADVAGTPVALVSIGSGGNACGVSTVILWRGESGIEDQRVGDDCGAPTPSISDDALLFVPWVNPGETGLVVQRWTPQEGLHTFGTLSYAPEAGTGWADIDPAHLSHPLDLFRNAAIYDAASALLGDGLAEYAVELGTATAPEMRDGMIVANGCVPHACGISDSFVAVDVAARAIYLARQADQGPPESWPAAEQWPQAAAQARREALGG